MSRPKTGPIEILVRAAWLEDKVDALPAVKGTIAAAWMDSRNRHMTAVTELRAELDRAIPPISARNDNGTFTVASMGIRTTSTMGIACALRNWITLARRKAQDPDRSL